MARHPHRLQISRVHSPGLTWVLVAGRPSHVSRFAGLTPRRRPAAACPECGRRLTLKLGRVRRHHAAHAPSDRCVATRPESALHIDLKFHLAARLEAAIGAGQSLVIRRQCAGTPPESCDATHELEWTRDWDEVVVEARLDLARSGRRPDILLRRKGKAIGAIEVLVSHAVGEEKAAGLAAAAIPWVEIRADGALLSGEGAWDVDRPLSVEREGPWTPTGTSDSCGSWRCPRHEETYRLRASEAVIRRAAEAEAARRAVVLRAARVVDICHAGGERDRVIYRVDEQLLDGHVHALTLRRGGLEIISAPANDSAESKRGAWTALRAMYAADIEHLAAPSGFVDSPMRWASGDAAENLVYEALSDLAPGDPTPLVTKYPRRWFYARERGQWFLPRDMRDVRWDRPTGDVFAAHPAWTASRRVVRERPVPLDKWRSIVFASRPSPASFGPTRVTNARVTSEGPITVLDIEVVHPLVRRALVVLTARAADDEVRRVAHSLDAAGVEHLWLSHPRDWTSSRADLAWAPAARDERGHGVVVVDGIGVYRAEQFLRAFGRGDRRLTPEAIRAKTAERVAVLGGRLRVD